MQYDERITCPSCCKQGRWGEDARSWHLHNDLKPEQTAFECDECMEPVTFRPAGAGARRRAGVQQSNPAAAIAATPSAAADADSCRFFFVDAARLRAYSGKALPHYQTLISEQPGMLAPLRWL